MDKIRHNALSKNNSAQSTCECTCDDVNCRTFVKLLAKAKKLTL